MPTTLIILAHPEPKSFTASWAGASAAAACAAGDEVIVTDLCAMGFDAVERAAHFDIGAEVFDPLKAHEKAASEGALPADIAAEVDKLRRADRVIFHFPIWWFAPPAVVKGWADRVLVHGDLHDVDHRFDTGRLRGKSAVFCVSTGATAAEGGPDGKEGDTRLLLWPLAQTLRYLGMEVLESVIVPGVHGYFEGREKAALEARLAGVLVAQTALLAGWDNHPRLRFNPETDFDAEGRLRPDAPSHSPFIRHPT